MRPELLIPPSGLLPIKPDLVIKEILRLKLEELDEIIPELDRGPLAGSQIGGILDRELNRVVVAKTLPLECRRFTILHGAGHGGCGIGSCGVPRPSLADYVIGTESPRGATAAGKG